MSFGRLARRPTEENARLGRLRRAFASPPGQIDTALQHYSSGVPIKRGSPLLLNRYRAIFDGARMEYGGVCVCD